MLLLSQLKKSIMTLTDDKDKNENTLAVLFKRRKDYRKRLTKLTNKKHKLLEETSNENLEQRKNNSLP